MRVLAAAALSLLAACAAPAATPAAPTATPSASAVSTTSSPSPSPSPTKIPNPTSGPGTYTSVALAYRVQLPAGWRLSQCQSGGSLGPRLNVTEAFTDATIDEESGGDIAPAQTVVGVRVQDNPEGRTPLQWLEAGNVGFSSDTAFERATVDGRDGARVVTQAGATITLVTGARGRIYAVGVPPIPRPVPPEAVRLMNSLHVLDDAELAAAQATLASPAPLLPRTAEELADTLKRGLEQRDTTLLAAVSYPCLTRGIQNGGGSFASASRVLEDLRRSFAAGLTVTVVARPITSTSGGPDATITSTWNEPGQAPRRVTLLLRARENTWYWWGWIDHRTG